MLLRSQVPSAKLKVWLVPVQSVSLLEALL